MLRSAVLIAFHLLFARPVLRWVGGLRYRRRNLVPTGPCVVVSNHNSHLDAAVLMGLFPLLRLPRVHPVAAADYFGQTWFKRTLALLLMNGISIERNPSRGVDPLAPLLAALEDGHSLVFFPEGSRGEAGVVGPFRGGIGRLVQKFPGLSIVPVYLSGPERIWARGHVVPVPLDIDAVVGRPRTYAPELEPKAIADALRQEVLALAPPPPPPPEPRPARPLRIAVCGIEAGLRGELFRAVVGRLEQEGRTIGLSEQLVEGCPEGLREVHPPVPLAPARPWLGLIARLFRTSGLFQGDGFVALVDRAQSDEVLGHDVARRFLVTDGSALVDLMAWAEAELYRGAFDAAGMNRLMLYLSGQKQIPLTQWWKFVRQAPEVWLVNVLDLVRPPLPDVLVLVRRPRTAGSGALDEAYDQVAGVLEKRGRIVVAYADSAAWNPVRLAERVALQAVRAYGTHAAGAAGAIDGGAGGEPQVGVPAGGSELS